MFGKIGVPNMLASGRLYANFYARLSPEQRVTARENFRRAYELPADQRQEKLQRYQELPEDKKRALADQAAKKEVAPPPPSPTPAPTTN
jgi:hypothetical protein